MKLLALAIFASLLRAQEPAGVIEGSLRDAVTRAPLADARVGLHGPAAHSTTTSPSGTFRFDQLPPGDYELTIQKSGYLDSSNATVRQAVRLKPGAVTEAVVIDLTPLGGLEGAVLDEAGRPFASVSVTIAGFSRTTDKDGRFAFDDIVPGPYQVAVSVPHEVRSRNLSRDSSTGDYYGYPPAQYYPDALDPRLAIPVVVPAGARLQNIDLRLRRTLLVEFTGHLIETAGGELITGADVQLTGAVSGISDPLWRRHPAATDGTFRFSLIQPGSYTLSVYRTYLSPLPYLVPIEIGKAGVDDLPVAIPPFARLTGTIGSRDPKLGWLGSAGISLKLPNGATMSRETRPDGNFDFESVPPGEYTVEVRSSNLRLRSDNKRKPTVSAIHFGSQVGFRKPVTVVENGNPPLEVLLSDDPAGIAGRVVDSSAQPGSRYLVVVAGLVPRRSLQSLMIASPDFQFPELAPGDYDVTAWPGFSSLKADANRTLNADANKTCDETIRVTVRDGAVSTITLRPCP